MGQVVDAEGPAALGAEVTQPSLSPALHGDCGRPHDAAVGLQDFGQWLHRSMQP